VSGTVSSPYSLVRSRSSSLLLDGVCGDKRREKHFVPPPYLSVVLEEPPSRWPLVVPVEPSLPRYGQNRGSLKGVFLPAWGPPFWPPPPFFGGVDPITFGGAWIPGVPKPFFFPLGAPILRFASAPGLGPSVTPVFKKYFAQWAPNPHANNGFK